MEKVVEGMAVSYETTRHQPSTTEAPRRRAKKTERRVPLRGWGRGVMDDSLSKLFFFGFVSEVFQKKPSNSLSSFLFFVNEEWLWTIHMKLFFIHSISIQPRLT